MKVCPACNKLMREAFPCSHCRCNMENKGRVEDYLDDYSADMPIEDGENYCKHVYLCSNCNAIKNYSIKMINT
jgi:hypothetical protein